MPASGFEGDASLGRRRVTDLLATAVDRFGEKPALIFEGRRTSFAQLGGLVERATRGFQNLGISKGDRVGLFLPNTPFYVICYFAILGAGGVVVNFNPLYAEHEIEALARDSGVRIIVTLDLPEHVGKLAPLFATAGLEHLVVCPLAEALPLGKSLLYRLFRKNQQARVPPHDARWIPFVALLSDAAPATAVTVDAQSDLAVLQYTGGTTGLPKAAMLTHANLTANAEQLVRWLPDVREGDERILMVLPLFHVFAMTVGMLTGMASGAMLILVPRFDLQAVIRAIARLRATLLPGVPTLYNAINEATARRPSDLTSIRFCISGGAPLPVEVRARFETLTGCRLVEGYGLSETSPVLTCNPLDGLVKDASVGLPMPGTEIEIRALDDPARLLGAGEVGEICARGPQVMRGYWNRPEENAASFIEGAFRTGDVGYRDADGYLFIVDRIKDMINNGGFKVYPRAVEEALYRHPAVAEAIVVGVPDPRRGQVPKAFVRLHPGTRVTADDLHAFLGHEISPLEMPREIEFRAALPRTTVGKLSRRDLAEEEARKAQAAGRTGGVAAISGKGGS